MAIAVVGQEMSDVGCNRVRPFAYGIFGIFGIRLMRIWAIGLAVDFAWMLGNRGVDVVTSTPWKSKSVWVTRLREIQASRSLVAQTDPSVDGIGPKPCVP